MKRLAPGVIMLKHDYWPLVWNARNLDPTVGDWQSDFISVSFNSWPGQGSWWGVHVPLRLRPDQGFHVSSDDLKFTSLGGALDKAVKMGLDHDTFVVICSNPVTGEDLSTSRDHYVQA